jgi:acyl carrier protein
MSEAVQSQDVQDRISTFIVGNFLFGDEAGAPTPDQSLLASGIVDSTGILELIEFLESEFAIQVGEDETTPENLDSLEALGAFVARKTSAA